MTLTQSEHEKNIMSLVSLGTKGIFPLFNDDWLSQIGSLQKQKLTGKDLIRNNNIFKSINKHKGLDRKKTVLLALTEEERRKFIVGFMLKVEQQIMDTQPELQ